MSRGAQTGFTLLEVLVAMTVLALALGAIIKAGGQSASNLVYLRDKTVAGWVAENQIAERLLLPDWPPLGEDSGSEEMVGREWRWKVVVQGTTDEDLRRIDVTVAGADSDADPLVRLSAFRGRGK